MNVVVDKYLPQPRVRTRGREQRFLVKHRRQEPDA